MFYCSRQLAAEIQVFLVGVTAYIVTRGRARGAVLGALLVLGAAAPALHTFLQDLDAVFVTPQYVFINLDVFNYCSLPTTERR